MEVSGILSSALHFMELDGWAQRTREDGMGLSADGAVWHVISEQYDWNDGGRQLVIACTRALREETGIPNLALWNDNPERTFQQVKEVFRRAICTSELAEFRSLEEV